MQPVYTGLAFWHVVQTAVKQLSSVTVIYTNALWHCHLHVVTLW